MPNRFKGELKQRDTHQMGSRPTHLKLRDKSTVKPKSALGAPAQASSVKQYIKSFCKKSVTQDITLLAALEESCGNAFRQTILHWQPYRLCGRRRGTRSATVAFRPCSAQSCCPVVSDKNLRASLMWLAKDSIADLARFASGRPCENSRTRASR